MKIQPGMRVRAPRKRTGYVVATPENKAVVRFEVRKSKKHPIGVEHGVFLADEVQPC